MFSLFFGLIKNHVYDICNLHKQYKKVTSWTIGIHLFIGFIEVLILKSDNFSFHFKCDIRLLTLTPLSFM